jgi:pantetheine-phosphate adenylyltransferase|tara:strand:+ start:901 stop:1401 length:501 start_codon:yes stop_codon:yes gene_type:complete
MTVNRIGLFPGTFDPVTLGHLDLIKRSSKLVSTLIVGVAKSYKKEPFFDITERVKMVESEVKNLQLNNVKVSSFGNLLADFAAEVEASIVFRGLRAVADFEYEYQMVGMNKTLNSDLETIFLMSDTDTQFISSELVKEVAKLGGDLSSFVTSDISKAIKNKLANEG